MKLRFDFYRSRGLLLRSCRETQHQVGGHGTMLHGTQVTGYVVEFFQSGKQGAVPNDMVYLKGDTVSDAVSQANWLARRTFHNHFQIRAVADGERPVIYTSSRD